jgi:hypothetical protein
LAAAPAIAAAEEKEMVGVLRSGSWDRKGQQVNPRFTFVATGNGVLRQATFPVFVDSDLDTCPIDARTIEPLVKIAPGPGRAEAWRRAGSCSGRMAGFPEESPVPPAVFRRRREGYQSSRRVNCMLRAAVPLTLV